MKRFLLLIGSLLLSFTAFAQEEEDFSPQYGYKLTDFASKPKFGAFIIGSYKYSSQEGANNGPGLGVRLIRTYVDGTVLRDFNYRIQFEINGTPHVKDFYLEWARYRNSASRWVNSSVPSPLKTP